MLDNEVTVLYEYLWLIFGLFLTNIVLLFHWWTEGLISDTKFHSKLGCYEQIAPDWNIEVKPIAHFRKNIDTRRVWCEDETPYTSCWKNKCKVGCKLVHLKREWHFQFFRPLIQGLTLFIVKSCAMIPLTFQRCREILFVWDTSLVIWLKMLFHPAYSRYPKI